MNLNRIISIILTIGITILSAQPSLGLETEKEDFLTMLTSQELTWIEANREVVINIATNSDSEALFYYEDDEVEGFVYDMISDLSNVINMRFNFIIDKDDANEQKLDSNEVDLLVGQHLNGKVNDGRVHTQGISSKPYWICSNSNYQSILDLTYHKVGFLKTNSPYDTFFELYDPKITPIFYDNQIDQFRAVFTGEVDAIMIIDDVKSNKYMNTYGLDRKFIVKDLQKNTCVLGNESEAILISIIDKYIEWNRDDVDRLVRRSKSRFLYTQLSLSESKEKYLDSLEAINVGYMVNFLPFDYQEAGEMKGISAELVKDISEILEKPINFVAYSSQLDMEQALLDGTIDMITSYGVYNNNIKNDFIQSITYSESNIAVLGHKNNILLPHRLNDLENASVAVIKDSWQEDLLQSNEINYEPIYVRSIHEAMEKVNDADADYTIENQWVFNYLMNEMDYDNLRPSGEIDIIDHRHLVFSKENRLLCNIVDDIIRMSNLKRYENNGLYENYQIQPSYEFYEVLTVALFLLLCFIGIYIAFLINKLNMERQKAEVANQSKSEFLAKMSHEIRTPLTAIMGYINLLSRSENITGKEKQQLKIAYNSSNILIHLVNDILDFSKIEAGKVSLVEQDFNLRLMINNAINIIGVMAEDKKLDFVVRLHQNLPKFIIGDERRLEQILINILSNSVKFTDEGMVELIISPEYFDDKVRLNFKVKDTGKGMKADAINMIFEAFEQEDNSISRRYGGTGLGLYISKDFIERMDGEIKVNSDVGKGTTFDFYTVHVLASEKEEVNEMSASLTIEELQGMKVLLVEDNDINQMIIRDILMDMGLKVIITNNGAEALEVVNPDFSFVMMDIQMPVMNGLDAIDAMRSREVLDGVPIIALTANVLPEQIDSYYKAGFDAYCSKPIMVNELAQTLLQMYEKYHMTK